MFKKAQTRALIAFGLGIAATASQAAAIDVAAVVTDIGAQAAPVSAIGGAVLVLMVAVKAFKWVRSALS